MNIEVLNKVVTIDRDTFQPILEVTVKILAPFELVVDSEVTGDIDQMYIKFGKELTEKVKQYGQ